MTKNTETKQPAELSDDEMDSVQGAGIPIGPLSKTSKQGIIVVDEDGADGFGLPHTQ